jgi:hypothetical protein
LSINFLGLDPRSNSPIPLQASGQVKTQGNSAVKMVNAAPSAKSAG